MSELMAAIGNPDTGSASEARSAFDAALTSGNPAAIASAAELILGHLEKGRALVAGVAGEPGAPDVQEFDMLFAGIAEGIAAMRDGGLAGDPEVVKDGRTRLQEALLDHFYQSVYGTSHNTMYAPDGRTITASRQRWSTQVGNAFDGVESTVWTVGNAAAPQWIEIDLGWSATITGVKLLTFQESPGVTDHRVTVRGAAGSDRDLTRFNGSTTDHQWLEYEAPTSVADVRVIRVTTLATPSMVGWREFEVSIAPGSTPSPCPAGSDNLTAGATVTGEPALAGRAPVLAADGDPATAWDPGDPRGPGNVRGWIRVTLARDALVSEVRVLLGLPAGGTAKYEITGWPSTGGRSVPLANIGGVTADGQWLAVNGPTPCVALRSVDIGVVSESPAAAVREVQVLGTVAP